MLACTLLLFGFVLAAAVLTSWWAPAVLLPVMLPGCTALLLVAAVTTRLFFQPHAKPGGRGAARKPDRER